MAKMAKGNGPHVAPLKHNNINEVLDISTNNVAPPKQYQLDIGIEVEKSVGGIEMGVLGNGMPYLTQRGLAKMTGVSRRVIFAITREWAEKVEDPIIGKGRNDFLKDYLFKNGYEDSSLYLSIMKDGSVHFAYPEIVCMAILEYFAFETQSPSEVAISSYRNLARYGLQKFIYDALQYVPPDKWRYYHDRVSILKDSAPPGYFILFNETTGLAVDLINSGLSVNDKTLPDISVGLSWGKLWNDSGLEERYGQRIKYEHNYPHYYRQAESNPQKPWAYPDDALPLFRRWFRTEYLLTKFPPYILSKAKLLPGGKLEAERIAALFDQKVLGGPNQKTQSAEQRKVGRPAERPMPDTIQDTPEKARPAVMVKPHSYQPSKAELESDVSIPGVSPEELARNLQNVLVIEDDDADTA